MALVVGTLLHGGADNRPFKYDSPYRKRFQVWRLAP